MEIAPLLSRQAFCEKAVTRKVIVSGVLPAPIRSLPSLYHLFGQCRGTYHFC